MERIIITKGILNFIQNTIDEWAIIFMIGGIAYIVPAILFTFFGSGEIQEWNKIPSTDSANEQRDEPNIDEQL